MELSASIAVASTVDGNVRIIQPFTVKTPAGTETIAVGESLPVVARSAAFARLRSKGCFTICRSRILLQQPSNWCIHPGAEGPVLFAGPIQCGSMPQDGTVTSPKAGGFLMAETSGPTQRPRIRW